MLLRRLCVLVLLAGIVALCEGAGDGSLGDTNIRYFGRWDKSGAVYHGYWGGTYIRVAFTGTTVKINLGNTFKYHVQIDGGAWSTITAVNGITNLTPAPLKSGTHTLIVVQGQDYGYDFAFKGLVLDPGATTIAPSMRHGLIEWIGDSITDGYTDTRSDVSAYAWICAESLACEHTQIAYPGIALTDGYGVNAIKTGMSKQYFKLKDISFSNAPDWDFSKYTPSIVVVALGTNDRSQNVPLALYQSTYVKFLSELRAKFPLAHLVVLVPHTGAYREQDSAAHAARVAAGDMRVHYINASNWLLLPKAGGETTDGLHPSDSGHRKLARLLRPLLAPYIPTTWIAGRTPSAQLRNQISADAEELLFVNLSGMVVRRVPVGSATRPDEAGHGLPPGVYRAFCTGAHVTGSRNVLIAR
jgi:lysophospholipase L1-like esterase